MKGGYCLSCGTTHSESKRTSWKKDIPLIWYQVASDSVIGKTHALTMLNKKRAPMTMHVTNVNQALFPEGIAFPQFDLTGKNKVDPRANPLTPIWMPATGWIPDRIRKNKIKLFNPKAKRKDNASLSHLKTISPRTLHRR